MCDDWRRRTTFEPFAFLGVTLGGDGGGSIAGVTRETEPEPADRAAAQRLRDVAEVEH